MYIVCIIHIFKYFRATDLSLTSEGCLFGQEILPCLQNSKLLCCFIRINKNLEPLD